MANKKYSRKTSEQKKEEIKKLSNQALEQIEKYSKSPEDLLEYADFMSQFYHYSTNNNLLIQNQFSGAVAVSSFIDWKDKGYSVNKGEKGIEILSYTPITLFKDESGNDKQIRYASKEEKEKIKNGMIQTRKAKHYKVGHVYDVSQTNAKVEDLPKIFPNRQYNFQIEEGNNIESLRKGIEAVANDLDINIKDMKDSNFGFTELGSAKGAFVQGLDPNKKEIVMNSRNTETQALATSIHELAHARLHNSNEEESKYDSPTKEFQAELTSYIVCKHYGMDTSEKAIPYIASWTANGDKLEDKQKAIEGVHKTSKEFIEIIDQVISQERELELHNETDLQSKIPTVNFEWSESNDVPTGKNIALPEAEALLLTLNEKERDELGYDKTKFNINYQLNGKEHTYQGRYDIGSEHGGLINHIEEHVDSVLKFGHCETEEQKEAYETLKNDVVPMFKEVAGYEVEQKILYPEDPDQTIYCDLTGKAIAQDEGYYHLGDGSTLSEKAHALMYTDEEWNAIYTDDGDNYWTTSDYGLSEDELTTEEPEPIKDKNLYYHYNGQSKPEKLGTINDIVSSIENQETIGHFVYSQQFIHDLAHTKYESKETFNTNMEQYNVLKNPNKEDFQAINKELGIEPNENLEGFKDSRKERYMASVNRDLQR